MPKDLSIKRKGGDLAEDLIAGTFPAFKNAIPKDLKFYAVF